MPSPPTLDIDALLAPISEEAPAGVNLRDDVSPTSPYFQLKDARSAARAAERRADDEADSGRSLMAEWRTILTVAPKVLAERSKDLEITAWLIEAQVRAHGFPGLRDGLALARGMAERYWDVLHSLEDEEGVATKVAPITGLNGLDAEGALIQPLRKVPLTVAADEGPFSAYQYEQAQAVSQIADAEARARREKSGAVTLERFTAAVRAGTGAFYVAMIDDLNACLAEIEAMGAVFQERAGDAAPPTSAIRNLLRAILDMVQDFSKDLVAREAPAAAEAEDGTAPGAAQAGGGGVLLPQGSITGREEALRVLLQVAEYFRKTEPHSPISSALEEVVRRARMPFAELLAELLPDSNAWRSVLTSAGIKPPS